MRQILSAHTEVDLPKKSLPRPDFSVYGIGMSVEVREIEVQLSNPEWLYSNERIDVKLASPWCQEWFDFHPRYDVM